MHKIKKINIFQIKNRNLFLRILLFIFVLYTNALVFNIFLSPTHIVSGGSNGLAVLLNQITNINSTVIIAIIYITMLILSFIFLDIESSISLVIATVLYPFFVEVTSNISDIIHMNYSNLIVVSIFAGILNGLIIGFTFKIGFNLGGLNVISQILNKYFKISISKVNSFLSFIIVLCSGYFISVNSILYAIIVIYLTNIFTDKMLLGISNNKLFYIITDKEEEVKSYVISYLTHGVTLIKCETAYTNRKKHAILCAIPTKQYFLLKEGIQKIDKHAFFVITDAYQVLGGF